MLVKLWKSFATIEVFNSKFRKILSAFEKIYCDGYGCDSIVAAMVLCRQRGTIVLKSTVARMCNTNLAPVVRREKTIRRGALPVLAKFPVSQNIYLTNAL
jgi:hypothetical protein